MIASIWFFAGLKMPGFFIFQPFLQAVHPFSRNHAFLHGLPAFAIQFACPACFFTP
ncbi:hypothetical protein B4099_3199 [Heyndrickxia coagulans]|uniref:Uncharacterized protein n=1 Tax=Heyndrickxia coagulans TaxID=1398 RepID=A0A150KGR7_HEYCO|nr:hypothetical protein B4099_3199 [Heyndrickxia coagulans]